MKSRVRSIKIDQLIKNIQSQKHHHQSSPSSYPILQVKPTKRLINRTLLLRAPTDNLQNQSNRTNHRQSYYSSSSSNLTLTSSDFSNLIKSHSNQEESSSSSERIIVQSDPHLKSDHSSISSQDKLYLQWLSSSVLNNSNGNVQINSIELWSIFKRLDSHSLFSQLELRSIERLINLIGSDQLQPQEHNQQLLIDSHQQILFILDRIHESVDRFDSSELARLHTLCLRRYAYLGYYDGAEIVWDLLITKTTTAAATATETTKSGSAGSTLDKLLMISCIHRDLVVNTSVINSNDQSSILEPDQSLDRAKTRSKKQLGRMIKLSLQLGNELLGLDQTDGLTGLSNKRKRWIIRSVSEILCSQAQVSKLQDWLEVHLAINLQYPDNGSSLRDPRINSGIIGMYRGLDDLERMISIYYAAKEPSGEMIRRSRQKNKGHILRKGYFDSASIGTTEEQPSTDDPESIEKEEDREKLRIDYSIATNRKSNVVLTKTYHDLIQASVESNKAHLAIHFLREAIESYDQDLKRLVNDPEAVSKHGKGSDGKVDESEGGDRLAMSLVEIPQPRSILRLQPSNYSGLVKFLIKKNRDCQLNQVKVLTEDLIRSIVEELGWVRDQIESKLGTIDELQRNRSRSIDGAVNFDGLIDHEGLEYERLEWEDLLKSILPNEHENLEEKRKDNKVLENFIFSERNDHEVLIGEESDVDLSQQGFCDRVQDRTEQEMNGSSKRESHKTLKGDRRRLREIRYRKFLRLKERLRFLLRSLTHSIELVKNLEPIIRKTKLNRSIRFESKLISKRKLKLSEARKGLRVQNRSALSLLRDDGGNDGGGKFFDGKVKSDCDCDGDDDEKIENLKKSLRSKVEKKLNDQKLRGVYNNYDQRKKNFEKVKSY